MPMLKTIVMVIVVLATAATFIVVHHAIRERFRTGAIEAIDRAPSLAALMAVRFNSARFHKEQRP
jgi:hypothetical protein